MPSETTMIHVRVNSDLKKKASLTPNKMGLSMSDAVRLLLTRVEAEQAFPFEVRVPNAETIAAMEAGDRGEVISFGSIEEMMADLNAND